MNWENELSWLVYDEDINGGFCRVCKQTTAESATQHTGGVDLVVSCGARELQVFVENASRKAVYTSRGAVVDFIEALETWVEESILKRLQKSSVFSVVANKCTGITAVEELSVLYCWEEDGTPVMLFGHCAFKESRCREHIFNTCQVYRDKNLQVGNVVGMGLDGAATLSGKMTVVQARLMKHAPHAVFVHCHCHLAISLCASYQ